MPSARLRLALIALVAVVSALLVAGEWWGP